MKVSMQVYREDFIINLPDELLAAASIKPNDILNVEIHNSRILLSKVFQHRTLIERAADFDEEFHLSEEMP